MALGPMDIHHKEFNTVRMGGYNKEEVDAFLDQVADELDRQLHRNQEMMGLLESMKARLTEYDNMQQTLQNALINAQKSADAIVQEARNQAEQTRQQAQAQVAQMLEQARAETESLTRQAAQAKEEAIREAAAEKQRLLAELEGMQKAVDSFLRAARRLLSDLDSTMNESESRLRGIVGAALEEVKEGVIFEEAGEGSASVAEALVSPAPSPQEPVFTATGEIAAPETLLVPEQVVEPPAAAPLSETPLFMPSPYETTMPLEAPEAGPAEFQQLESPSTEVTFPSYAAPSVPQPSPWETQPAAPEPQAYVPPIPPLQEAREEEAPIPPIHAEAAPAAPGPQAYVPPIRLSEESATPKEEESYPQVQEPAALMGKEAEPYSEIQPSLPEQAPEVTETAEEPREEKHFFWE